MCIVVDAEDTVLDYIWSYSHAPKEFVECGTEGH